jgi:hypothetical protein
VNPRNGLDDLEKIKSLTLPTLELRPLSSPDRSQSLYRLRYLAPPIDRKYIKESQKGLSNLDQAMLLECSMYKAYHGI